MTVQKYLDDDGHVSDAGMNEAVADYLEGLLEPDDFNLIVKAFNTGKKIDVGVKWSIEQMLASQVVSPSANSWAGLVTVLNEGTTDGVATLTVNGSVESENETLVGNTETLSWSVEPPDVGETKTYEVAVGDESRSVDVTCELPSSGVFIKEHNPRVVEVEDSTEAVNAKFTVVNTTDEKKVRWLFVDYQPEVVKVPANGSAVVEVKNVLNQAQIDLEEQETQRISCLLQPSNTAYHSEVEDRATITVRKVNDNE